MENTNIPGVSFVQLPVASHPDDTYTVDTNDTSQTQFQPNMMGSDE
jgi:hypothetical protein